ncbi:hypothetical protein CBR_g17016 [Chara braunii]|uniref:Transposase MuDR plant domain-containing protein n=1 Tax=Chara braunii TaxID=69332 RepID=A0A388KUD3_CHABU|nr:hypothetical protein CBR_g17016 [Chara braunii]|eukprot:GBG73674.1 hypothetical protein CBR_g17016 [Chara braunii]
MVFEDGGLEHILWYSDEDGASDKDVDDSSGEFDDVEPVTGAPLPRLPDEVGVVRAAQEFANITELRKVVADDAVKKKYEFRIVKSNATRYTVKCKVEGCGWRLHASAVHGGPTFKIKSMTAHCCARVSKFSNNVVTAAWVSQWIEPRLRNKPDYSPVDIVKDIYRQHGVSIKYRLAWSAKEVAKAKIAGLNDDGFHNLWMYCDEVQNSNPGSRAFVQTKEGYHRFKRMFYALEKYRATYAGLIHPLRPRELWASDKVAGDADGKDGGEGSGVEGDDLDVVESSVLPPVARAGRGRRTKVERTGCQPRVSSAVCVEGTVTGLDWDYGL